jgi:hypothetical protein
VESFLTNCRSSKILLPTKTISPGLPFIVTHRARISRPHRKR